MLSRIPARPEQPFPKSITNFVSESLRAAAMAPTLSEALDLTGEALSNIASFARGERTESTDAPQDNRFRLARDAAERTMLMLDRVTSLFEAIRRCASDEDCAIVDLAMLGREIAQAEVERIDVIFTELAHRSIVAEVQS